MTMQPPIRQRSVLSRGSSLRRFANEAQTSVRMVCFPWCGAGASVYRKLASELPKHIDLLAVQMPGKEDRFGEPGLRRMEHIIEHVVEDLIPLCDRKLVLFGHSMGSLVAHETAQALRKHIGREPDLLIVSGHSAPIARQTRKRQWHLADEEAFIGNLRRLGGTPPSILDDRGMMQLLMPMLRADYEALETYVSPPSQPLSCPLFVCAGRDDTEITPAGIEAWRGYTVNTCQVQWFDGGHFYLSTQSHILARHITEWIAGSAPYKHE